MNRKTEQKPPSKLEELTGKYTYPVLVAGVVVAGMFCYALAVQPFSILSPVAVVSLFLKLKSMKQQ